MAFSDLEEIEGFIRYSLKAMKDVEARKKNAPVEVKDTLDLDEPWIHPVVCYQLPSFEPENKKSRSTKASHEVDVLDVIRAFCHPRVIETVSKVLQEEFQI